MKHLILKNKVLEFRKDKGFTQQSLADIIGTTRNTILAIESGRFSPSAHTALLLCLALECDFEELFFFDMEE